MEITYYNKYYNNNDEELTDNNEITQYLKNIDFSFKYTDDYDNLEKVYVMQNDIIELNSKNSYSQFSYKNAKKNKTEEQIFKILSNEYDFLTFSHKIPLLFEETYLNDINLKNNNDVELMDLENNTSTSSSNSNVYLNINKYNVFENDNKLSKKIKEFNIPLILNLNIEDLILKNLHFIILKKEVLDGKKILISINNTYVLNNEKLNISKNEYIQNNSEFFTKIMEFKNYNMIINDFTINKTNKTNKNNKYDLIITNFANILSTFHFKNENNSLKNFIPKIMNILDIINIKGDLWINLNFLPINLVSYQLIYLISLSFEKTEFMKDKIYENDINSGIFVFKNYNGINIFKKLFENNINNNIKVFAKNDEDNEDILFSLFSKKYIDKSFYKYLYFIFNQIDKKLEKFNEKIKYIHNKIILKRQEDKIEFFYNIILKNSIEYCKNNNIKIFEFYNDSLEKNFNYEPYKFKFFPKEKGVDIKKLKLTFESLYSVSYPDEAEETSLIIKKHFPDVKIIVDANANVGGNTINFSKHFDKVLSIEIDNQTYLALKHNVQMYHRNNVDIYNHDCIQLLKENTFKDKLVFFDPPWGGIFYRIEDKNDLFLSKINIVDILPNNFVLKAPLNYNIENLLNKFPEIIIHKMHNYIIIIGKNK